MPVTPPLPKDLRKEVDAVLESLTLEEQVSLLAGKDFWRTVEIPGKVASLKTTDGPSGARGQYFSGGTKAAFFPSGVSLAATWDPALIHRIGVALGEETRTKQAQILLAPTACNHRSPLGGRNFESFSEDPFLAGKLAAAYVAGVQSQDVAVTMKHFVANEQETRRFSVNELVEERALREIYLKPFEIAMRDVGPWAVMSSYNKINGHHADLHPFTLKKVLREEWGFDGLVLSDWGGTNSTTASLLSGLDLEMPGPARRRGDKLLAALKKTPNPPALLAAIKASARHVLELVARTGHWGKFHEPPEEAVDKPAHRTLIRSAGAAGIVLLKNEHNTLPIPAHVKKVAWIGPNANETIAGGGGSANLNPHYLTNPLSSFRAALPEDVQVQYEIGCRTEKWVRVFPVDSGRARTAPGEEGEPGLVVEFFAGRECSGLPVETVLMETSNIFLMDAKPAVLGEEDYSVRVTTYIQPETTGPHVFGVGSIGPTKIFIDGELFIDHTKWTTLGELFFTSGSEEVTKTTQLEGGRWYKITAETTSKGPEQPVPDMGNDNLDFSAAVGIRMGIDAVGGVKEGIDRAVALAAASDVAVVVVGMNNEWESEGYDRATMALPGAQNELVAAVAAANPCTIVVNQSGCAISMPWLSAVPAVLQAWYQGQEAGNALADVLTGRTGPSGRLPITFPKRLEDNPAFGNFGDGGEGNEVLYSEGVFVGYRHYNSREIPVLFPFGFGLAYTCFEIGVPRVAEGGEGGWRQGGTVVVEVEVKNTGERKGAEVVQVYVEPPMDGEERPRRELKGWGKIELESGEEGVVRVVLDEYAPGMWCAERKKWWAREGAYRVVVGRNVEDVVGAVEVRVEREYVWVF